MKYVISNILTTNNSSVQVDLPVKRSVVVEFLDKLPCEKLNLFPHIVIRHIS